MTSVTSFYFATRAGTSTAKTPTSSPTLASVVPTEATRAAAPFVVALKIFGTDLQLAKTVKLKMSGGAMLATDITSSEQLIKCDLTIDPGLAAGKYDVVVTNSDGGTATLPGAFEVK